MSGASARADEHDSSAGEGEARTSAPVGEKSTGSASLARNRRNGEPSTRESEWRQMLHRAQSMDDDMPLLVHPNIMIRVRDEVLAKLGENKTVGPKERVMLDKCVLFFARVFGIEGKKQLHQFLGSVRDIPDALKGLQGISSSCRQLVKPGAPLALRRTIDAYQRQAETRTSVIVNRFLRYIHMSDFYHQYDLMVQEALKDGTETRQLFEGLGLTTSHGRDWRSVVNDYLVHVLEDVKLFPDSTDVKHRKARVRLKNELALSRPYRTMESTLGRGVFALLPEQDINRYDQCIVDNAFP